MATPGIFKALLVLIASACFVAATPTPIADGGHLTCSSESHPVLERFCVIASIEHFCHDKAGHHFSNNTALGGSFYVAKDATTFAPIHLTVTKSRNKPYASCSSTLEVKQCIAQMTLATSSCNDFNTVNVTSSGCLKDTTCGWQWEVDISPRPNEDFKETPADGVAGGHFTSQESNKPDNSPGERRAAAGDRSEDSPNGPVEIASSNLTNRMGIPDGWNGYECFSTGYQIPLYIWEEGLQDSCKWMDGRSFDESESNGEWAFTLWWWGPDGKLHKTWYSFQSAYHAMTVAYDDCIKKMDPLVVICRDGLSSQGGRAYTIHETTTWIVDNDPDLHRPGVALDPPS
ncbi:hypothetical protein LTS10_000168 [Elasticomyces elasticus]|nr:hypothetical protein LTS10_000168 [Elasticomyces elasticus]